MDIGQVLYQTTNGMETRQHHRAFTSGKFALEVLFQKQTAAAVRHNHYQLGHVVDSGAAAEVCGNLTQKFNVGHRVGRLIAFNRA